MRARWILIHMALVMAAGCFQDTTPQHSDFLPLDYRSSFKSVRPCRVVPKHDNHYQTLFANLTAADPYSAASFPLPAGSVVLAEEYNDPSCTSLIGFRLMAKEAAGYDPANGDWHWQELDANQRVLKDGRLTTCSSCHAQPPCNDFLCSQP